MDPLRVILYRSSNSNKDEDEKAEDEDSIGEPRGEITSRPERLLE